MFRRKSSLNLRAVGGAVTLLWGTGALPLVAADQVCYTTIDGFWSCTKRLSLGVRIAICIGASILLSVLITLCLCLGVRRRRAREEAAIAEVYQVEASQIQGPPTTYVTSFDPRSPASYPLPNSAFPPTPDPPSAFPRTPAGYPHTPDAEALSADPRSYLRSPAPSVKSPHIHFQSSPRYQGRFSVNPPSTAPVNPGYTGPGAYPFPGYSAKAEATQQPHSAYPRFPRPLYTAEILSHIEYTRPSALSTVALASTQLPRPLVRRFTRNYDHPGGGAALIMLSSHVVSPLAPLLVNGRTVQLITQEISVSERRLCPWGSRTW
ncbi:hypothetical protein LshimejAT787_1202740 [Lyophyllum shimeji]|uniref:Uncharacterized protein n=1 Tax=Lyophyllum shimeji TaxID=47721 RepID=A0A9P3PTY5_LYOSH|nr:hypothetical protein LshimejAT787_1202740 [Lyophyllum shimeji]